MMKTSTHYPFINIDQHGINGPNNLHMAIINPICRGGVEFGTPTPLGVTYEGSKILGAFLASYEGFLLPPAGLLGGHAQNSVSDFSS